MGAKYERGLMEDLYMHIGQCAMCNTALSHGRGSACDVGRNLSYQWLEYRHRQGDKSATYILDHLKEKGKYKL